VRSHRVVELVVPAELVAQQAPRVHLALPAA
jgi:hypothetical protein